MNRALPEAWQSIRLCTADVEYSITLEAVEQPAALHTTSSQQIEALRQLDPPYQAGPFGWEARICYWGAEQLQELCSCEVRPTLVYRFLGTGRQDKISWNKLVSQLQQPPQPAAADTGDEQAAAAAAAANAAAGDGTLPYRNALLLHVAGRYNDDSIKMLLVPVVNTEAASSSAAGASKLQCVLWAYFMVLPCPSFEDRMAMYVQPSMSTLQLAAVTRAIRERRSQNKVWQACIEFQQQNALLDNGLPSWTKGSITLCPHLAAAEPRGQLDFVDRCFIKSSDADKCASSSRTPKCASNSSSSAADACAAGYAAAGADQLLPLCVGTRDAFEQACSCPAGMWCGGAARRKQLLQLWAGEVRPALEIRPCDGGKGLGLFAREDMPVGTLVGEYCGELILLKELEVREQLYHKHMVFYTWKEDGQRGLPPDMAVSLEMQRKKSRIGSGSGGGSRPGKVQAMALPQGLAIDATWVGGVARFINHSCEPNCHGVMVCNGRGTGGCDGSPLLLVLMETLQDVKAGEELTFDYSPVDGSSKGLKQCKRKGKLTGLLDCKCGASECRGVVFPKKK